MKKAVFLRWSLKKANKESDCVYTLFINNFPIFIINFLHFQSRMFERPKDVYDQEMTECLNN